MVDSLFVREGDLYRPTRLTEGPWSPDAQHGGPPAALLAGAIEKTPFEVEMVLARISVELLRPVPLRPLVVAAEVVRPGKRVQLVAAKLSQDGEEVARALGLRIRLADLELPFDPTDDEDIPPPTEGREATFFANAGAFATEAMEISMLEGDFSEPGPGKAWLRLKVPLIEGEKTTGVERVVAAADFGNGIGNLAGSQRSWVFINPDLTIHLARPPVGEWVFMDSKTRLHATGTGLATSILGDQEGRLGTAAQSLFVEPMADRGHPS